MITAKKYSNLLISLFSLFLSFFLAELVLHCLIPAPVKPQAFAHQLSENPKLLYEPAAGQSTRIDFDPGSDAEESLLYQINQDGFRDREYSIPKNPGMNRIVFMGDSVVFGYRVKLEDTVSKQLESELNKREMPVEVLNMGVSGYDTEQEVEFLKTKGLKYNPDIVILGYTLNDARYASWELDSLKNNWASLVKTPNQGVASKILSFFFDHSRILYLLNKRFNLQKKMKELRPYPLLTDYVEEKYTRYQDSDQSEYRRLKDHIIQSAASLQTPPEQLSFFLEGIGLQVSDPIRSSHWDFSYQSLVELKALAQKHSFKVVVVLWPFMTSLDRYPLVPLHQFLVQKFSSLGFTVIDAKEFLNENNPENPISGDSIHFTPYGAALAASQIAERLITDSQMARFLNRTEG